MGINDNKSIFTVSIVIILLFLPERYYAQNIQFYYCIKKRYFINRPLFPDRYHQHLLEPVTLSHSLSLFYSPLKMTDCWYC